MNQQQSALLTETCAGKGTNIQDWLYRHTETQ